MYMRLVRAHGLTSKKIERVVERYRDEDLGLIEAAPGFAGLAMGVNHVGGSVASISCWADESAMRESDGLSAQARERATSLLDDPEPMLVDRFALRFASDMPALADRATAPHMRLVRFTALEDSAIERAGECYADEARSLVGEVPGLDGVAIGVNHQAASLAVVSFWDCAHSLRTTERLSRQIRQRAARRTGARRDPLADRWALVDRFEITLASGLDRLAATPSRLLAA